MSALGRLYEPYRGWSDVSFYAFGRRVRRREDGLTAQWIISDLVPGPVSFVRGHDLQLLGQVNLHGASLALMADLLGDPPRVAPYRARRFVKVGDEGFDYVFRDEVVILEKQESSAVVAIPGQPWQIYTWPRCLLVPC